MKKKGLLLVAGTFLCLCSCTMGNGHFIWEKNDNKVTFEEQPLPDPVHTCVGDRDAGWQTSSTKHWLNCCDQTCDNKVHEASHEFDGEYDVVEPTCLKDGSSKRRCIVCGYEKTVYRNRIGHSYEKDSEGNDIVDWLTAPSCTSDGSGTKKCLYCSHEETVQVKSAGHTYTGFTSNSYMSGGGYASVQRCSACGDTILAFDSNEATNDSRKTLRFLTGGGASFKGYPIGNGITYLDNTYKNYYNAGVYDKNQKGDYFEFTFDLTSSQATLLSNCKLYCKATPADYMNVTGMDFWKNDANSLSSDFCGMYIDDLPEGYPNATEGSAVDKFRYLLYVDDVLQTMDESIDTPAGANGSRGEYVLSYTFHLHTGTNKIRLVMAGGYRSTFYNFTFRPCESD